MGHKYAFIGNTGTPVIIRRFGAIRNDRII
jgi:hypothetical protein